MKKISSKSKAISMGILDYLKDTKNNDLLGEVKESLAEEQDRVKNTDKIVITSVVKLSAEEIQKIKQALEKLLPMKLPIINKIENSLLGGFTVSCGDWFLDASLRHDIEMVKRKLIT